MLSITGDELNTDGDKTVTRSNAIAKWYIRPKGKAPLTVTTAQTRAIVTMSKRQIEKDDTNILESLGSTEAT